MSDQMEAAEYVAMTAEKKPRGHPEEDFQALVIGIARANGWRVHYMPDWVHRLIRVDMKKRRRARDWPDRGFPDLVLARRPRLIVVENKSAVGSLEPEQKEWIADLQAAGVDVRVWRPKNEEEIRAVLQKDVA